MALARILIWREFQLPNGRCFSSINWVFSLIVYMHFKAQMFSMPQVRESVYRSLSDIPPLYGALLWGWGSLCYPLSLLPLFLSFTVQKVSTQSSVLTQDELCVSVDWCGNGRRWVQDLSTPFSQKSSLFYSCTPSFQHPPFSHDIDLLKKAGHCHLKYPIQDLADCIRGVIQHVSLFPLFPLNRKFDAEA